MLFLCMSIPFLYIEHLSNTKKYSLEITQVSDAMMTMKGSWADNIALSEACLSLVYTTHIVLIEIILRWFIAISLIL